MPMDVDKAIGMQGPLSLPMMNARVAELVREIDERVKGLFGRQGPGV